MPVSSLIYLFIELIRMIISMVKSSFGIKKLKKFKKLLSNLQFFFMEASIIELWFYTTLNLTSYPGISEKNRNNSICYLVSFYIIISSILKYLFLFHKAKTFLKEGKSQEKLEMLVIDIGLDGLKFGRLVKTKMEENEKGNFVTLPKKICHHLNSTMNLNILFKFQLVYIPIILVTGQNFKTMTCGSLILIQVAIIFYILYLKMSLKNGIFRSWLYFLSYFLIVSVLLIISMIGLLNQEWHNIDYLLS